MLPILPDLPVIAGGIIPSGEFRISYSGKDTVDVSNGEGGGGKTFLGITFNKNISLGAALILLLNGVCLAFGAGMLWRQVVDTPGKIEALTVSMDKHFALIDDQLVPFKQQANQILDLYNRQRDLQTRQDEARSDIVQLRVDMRGVQADVSNIKAATAACMPGDRRPECRGRN